MNTTTTTAPAPIVERPHISWVTYEYMRQRIAELEATTVQLQADVNHWSMKATYTDLERQVMHRRRSRGADELTGEWPAADQQAAVA
ncbi:hypothetical protein QFZ53_001488 [Microbacterium natoriense]|uniref:Uncharacterized protein n=1 Tax=Microbacterium natoriense TaxID=284570 RepID=A0AAW8EW54_9MICO|nr:hypothetical protein [Microbacterium natoriense]MDQ0647292.1 hypothetical protein [Microbacterium natoriense]